MASAYYFARLSYAQRAWRNFLYYARDVTQEGTISSRVHISLINGDDMVEVVSPGTESTWFKVRASWSL